MCKAAEQTAAELAQAIEPTLVALLNEAGQGDTDNGKAAIAALNQAITALQGWKPGDDAQVAVEAINAFTSVFSTIPIPDEYKVYEGLISAGVVAILGVIEANTKAPEGTPQVEHESVVLTKTSAKIQTLVPGFKESKFTRGRAEIQGALGDHGVAAREYTKHWNAQVDHDGGKFEALRQGSKQEPVTVATRTVEPHTPKNTPTTRKAPAQKSYVVDAGQFQNLLNFIQRDHEVTLLESEGHTGSFRYNGDLDLFYIYDGTGTLRVTIVSKRGQYEQTPDAVVFGLLDQELIHYRNPLPPNIKHGAGEQYASQPPAEIKTTENHQTQVVDTDLVKPASTSAVGPVETEHQEG